MLRCLALELLTSLTDGLMAGGSSQGVDGL